MASRALVQGSVSALPVAPPLDAILAALDGFSRPALAIIAGRAVDRMDAMDPDPDLEPGDEPAAIPGWTDGGPGDPDDGEPENWL